MTDETEKLHPLLQYPVDLDECVWRYRQFFLRITRCALWELIGKLPDGQVIVSPGALNALGIDHESDHELLRCWTADMTEQWQFYPYKVERVVVSPPEYEPDSNDYYNYPMLKIYFAFTEKQASLFVSRGCTRHDFSVIVDSEDFDGKPVELSRNHLGWCIEYASFANHATYDQLTIADLNEIHDELHKELTFKLMLYGNLPF